MKRHCPSAFDVLLALLRAAPLLLWVLHPVAHGSDAEHGSCAAHGAAAVCDAGGHGSPAANHEIEHGCHVCSVSHTVRAPESPGAVVLFEPASRVVIFRAEPALIRSPLLGRGVSWRGPPLA